MLLILRLLRYNRPFRPCGQDTHLFSGGYPAFPQIVVCPTNVADIPSQVLPSNKTGTKLFHGLIGENTTNLANNCTYKGEKITQEPQPGVRASNSPGWDPGETYQNVNMQLFGSESNPSPGQTPTMEGFLEDYKTKCKGDEAALRQILHCYTPSDLPIISTLAKGYAVSDEWYASVPTQTNANRAFSVCGTSMGLVNNGEKTTSKINHWLEADTFDTKTIFNVLQDNHISWNIFAYEKYPPIDPIPGVKQTYTYNMLPQTHAYKENYLWIDEFYKKAEAGTLPAFSYLEPRLGGYIEDITVLGKEMPGVSLMGTEYHPPSDTSTGEAELAKIYQLLRNSPAWDETMFIIVFDEHGGTYDHKPPQWGAVPPWKPGEAPARPSPKTPVFGFDRFGVRVPAIVVSPYIQQKTVFRSPTHTPFDHTSMIATVLEMLLPPKVANNRDAWGLGERVKNAPAFTFLQTLDQPRTEDVLLNPVFQGPPMMGYPLKYGEKYCLRHQDGRYIAKVHKGVTNYYPTLNRSNSAPLRLEGDWGFIKNNDKLRIRTDEQNHALWIKTPSYFYGVRNLFTIDKIQSDVYYDQTNDADLNPNQSWIIKPISNDPNPREFVDIGDKVIFLSDSPKWKGQQLAANYRSIQDAYLTTKPSSEAAFDWFFIDRWDGQQKSLLDRLKDGEVLGVGYYGFLDLIVKCGMSGSQTQLKDLFGQIRVRIFNDKRPYDSVKGYKVWVLGSKGYKWILSIGELVNPDNFIELKNSLIEILELISNRNLDRNNKFAKTSISISEGTFFFQDLPGQLRTDKVSLYPYDQ